MHCMITTSNRFTRVFSNNYLHKSMLVKSLLHSIFHHIFRIFPPEDKESKAIDKQVLKLLWPIPSLKDPDELTPRRTTIAKKRVGAPIALGAWTSSSAHYCSQDILQINSHISPMASGSWPPLISSLTTLHICSLGLLSHNLGPQTNGSNF